MKIQPLNYRFSQQNRPSFKSQTEKEPQQNFDKKQKIVMGGLLAGSALLFLSGILSGRFSKKSVAAASQTVNDETGQQAARKRKLKHASEKLSAIMKHRASKKPAAEVLQAENTDQPQVKAKRKLKHASEKLSAIIKHRASKKSTAEVLQAENTDQPQVKAKRKLKNPSKKLYAIMEHRVAKDNERVIAREIEEDEKALELFNRQWEEGMDDTVKRFIERTPEEVERLLEIQEDSVKRLYK